MNSWTPRQLSGASIAVIGTCTTLLTPTTMQLVRSFPLFFVGLTRVTLAIVGPVFLVVGIYRIATKDRDIPAAETAFLRAKVTWLAIGVTLGMLAIYKTAFSQPLYADLPMSPPIDERQWVQVDANTKGDTISVDTPSIVRSGSRVEYWNKITFNQPRYVGNSLMAAAIIDRSVADCKTATVANVQSFALSKSGQSFNFAYTPRDKQIFLPVPANIKHPDAILFRYVCRR